MAGQSPIAEVRPPGIFLSYAHEDRGFVRHLAKDLSSSGVRVWVDEGEMGIGDSLLAKVTSAISEMDYLGVVISPNSAMSDWVTREVEIAMTEDIEGQKVKVLPLLLRDGEVPSALAGKVFADFTSEPAYATSLLRLLVRLGVEQELPPGGESDRLVDLASSSALLTSALTELRHEGLSNATSEAIVSSKIADVELSEFLSLIVQELQGSVLFGLALSLIRYIDERGVGQHALDLCFSSGRLDASQISMVGGQMQYVRSRPAALWCHSLLTSVVKSDAHYHSFLNRHIDTVVGERYDAMGAYLLHPNRGPGDYNIDSFDLVISHLENATPFQRRWIEWINDGYFDRGDKVGSEPARTLYLLLNERWDSAKFSDINLSIQSRVHRMMKSRSPSDLRAGMYHLVSMVDARFRGSEYIVENSLARSFDVNEDEHRILEMLKDALGAVVAYNRDRSEMREVLVKELYSRIADADRSGITGYWESW